MAPLPVPSPIATSADSLCLGEAGRFRADDRSLVVAHADPIGAAGERRRRTVASATPRPPPLFCSAERSIARSYHALPG